MSLRMKYVTLEDNPSRFQKSSQLLLCSQRSTLPTDRMSLETNSSEQSPSVNHPCRPPSTQRSFQAPHKLDDPMGVSIYDGDFNEKPILKSESARVGTSRANRPHPPQEFLVHRYKADPPPKNYCTFWSPPSDEALDRRVKANQLKSTYGSDFIDNVQQKAIYGEDYKYLTKMYKLPKY